MSNQAITAGDVVQLKSGGPLMTVEWAEGGKCWCVWFEGKKRQGEEFQLTSLTKTQVEGAE